jgi:hypothetical protein
MIRKKKEASGVILLRIIDLEASKFPISFRKSRWVAGDEIITCSWTMRLFRVELGLSAELTTQVDINDDTLVTEMRGDIAISVGEVGQGSSPGGRVWTAVGIGDIVWD